MIGLKSFPKFIEIRRHSPESPWTYARLDAHQRKIAQALVSAPDEEAHPSLNKNEYLGRWLVSELAPVVTLGRRASLEDKGHFTVSRDSFQSRGIEVYPTDRGGLATYHGPGQWVFFLVDRLENLTGNSRGVRDVVCRLLKAAQKVGLKYHPEAHLRDGAELGVWTAQGKFASVGVKVWNGVLLHGLSINAFRMPESFFGIQPCGLNAPVSYLLEKNHVSVAQTQPRFEALASETLSALLEQFRPPVSAVDGPVRQSYTQKHLLDPQTSIGA